MSRLIRLSVWLAGVALGVFLGWHAGFLSGVGEEAAMARESGTCYCVLDCCDHGDADREGACFGDDPLDSSCQRDR